MVLDRARLGKQRVECVQIMRAIAHGGGWAHHPADKMWSEHPAALALYHDCVIREWERRGYANNMSLMLPPPSTIVLPDWLGGEELHASHRAALLAKDPKWYIQFGWTEEPRVEYVWPRP